jgi:hypothetical protein
VRPTGAQNDPQRDYTSTVDEYGDLVSEYDGTDTTYHLHDGQHSMDVLLDENEAETDRFRHRAFGIEHSHTGTADTPFNCAIRLISLTEHRVSDGTLEPKWSILPGPSILASPLWRAFRLPPISTAKSSDLVA